MEAYNAVEVGKHSHSKLWCSQSGVYTRIRYANLVAQGLGRHTRGGGEESKVGVGASRGSCIEVLKRWGLIQRTRKLSIPADKREKMTDCKKEVQCQGRQI